MPKTAFMKMNTNSLKINYYKQRLNVMLYYIKCEKIGLNFKNRFPYIDLINFLYWAFILFNYWTQNPRGVTNASRKNVDTLIVQRRSKKVFLKSFWKLRTHLISFHGVWLNIYFIGRSNWLTYGKGQQCHRWNTLRTVDTGVLRYWRKWNILIIFN